ncbi:polyisoprenoid-binding protein [Mucilaginibacter terrenus]|uniref:Polyisoprenoid-binding protein n=1 Tax=Mucilaginibacter terrenus TaxID=2482727 RepID=A0A3E2NJS8_9SPHI|nr:YceI family protein [Mucilaginibacter terrenus]RFZ81247.1 polyisoprenoid-binding protein [Mucilaginibacter terrenus]
MKKLSLAILILTVTLSSFAQVANNLTKASVTFKIKNMGINTGGKIGTVQADVQFVPSDLAKSKIDATAESASINTDNEMRDNHLKGEDYFDVAKYPKITMRSISFKHNSGNNYTGQFNLTIKDKTKQVTVPFTYTEAGGTAVVKGSFKINRKNFGVGGSSLVLADEATITIEAEVSK